jgi:hypothetical protein
MASSEMLCHVALVGTDVSEECYASIIRVRRIGELRTLNVTIKKNRCVRRLLVMAKFPSSLILVTLMMEALSFLQNVGSYKSHVT